MHYNSLLPTLLSERLPDKILAKLLGNLRNR